MRTSGRLLAVVAVLAVAGCTAPNDPGPVSSNGAASSNSSSGGQTSDKRSPSAQQTEKPSPLEEYMGAGFDLAATGNQGTTAAARPAGGGQVSEEDLAKQRKVEDSIAACMKAAGFEYVPSPPATRPRGRYDAAFDLSPDDFAQQYGYGISTMDWAKDQQDQQKTDPNLKIRVGLSPNGQIAYDKALDGWAPPAGGGGGSGGVSGEQDQGCRAKAARAVYGAGKASGGADPTKFAALFKDLGALYKRIQNDQRVQDALAAWSSCLADAGHPGFRQLNDPLSSVQDRLYTLIGRPAPGSMGPPSYDKADPAKLAALRKFETGLAVADRKCRMSAYDTPYQEARDALETEFVQQNKAALEAYREAAANR